MKLFKHFIALFIVFLSLFSVKAQENLNTDLLELNSTTASHFAFLALNCMNKPFPYKDGHIIMDSTDNELPEEMHPAFYGCFDWHSSVHGHW
jgi:hypothetical protein